MASEIREGGASTGKSDPKLWRLRLNRTIPDRHFYMGPNSLGWLVVGHGVVDAEGMK